MAPRVVKLESFSSDKPQSIGYYIICCIGPYVRIQIAKVQMRLLFKEMKHIGLDDACGMKRV
jgi:hypothetical protein